MSGKQRPEGNGRCLVCGLETNGINKLARHLDQVHGLRLRDYRACFPGKAFEVLVDEWDDTDSDGRGNLVSTHVLIRRFVDRTRRAPRSRFCTGGCCGC